MATKRRKSIDDIAAQRERILGRIWDRTDSNFNTPEGYAIYRRQSRQAAKVNDIADRYINNIRSTSSFREGEQEVLNRQRNTRFADPLQAAESLGKGMAEITGKKYSRATYIGKANNNG